MNKKTLRVLAETAYKLHTAKGIEAPTAATLLAMMDEVGMWQRVKHIAITTGDGKLLLAMLCYLTDKRDGRAPQNVNVNATITHHTPETIERARALVRELLSVHETPIDSSHQLPNE